MGVGVGVGVVVGGDSVSNVQSERLAFHDAISLGLFRQDILCVKSVCKRSVNY